MGGASTVDTGRLVARPMRPVGVAARVSAALPTGGTLPDDVWRVRHQGIVTVLWLHVPLLFVFALIRGNSWPHGLLEAGAVAISAAAAQWSRERRRESTIFAAVGLMTASAVLVHLSGGMIEAHFHFFVMVGVIVLYQDWRPFLVAIAFVVLHHGVIGVLSPEDVYNHRGAWEHPWTWAAIHGLFILAMSVAGIANWKLNERSQSQLSRLAAIVESSDDAVYGWTLDGTITSWNEGAARLFGYTHNEVVGRPISLLVPPERAEEAAGQVECLRSGHRVDPFESEARRGDGGVVEVSVTNFAVRTPAGEVVGGATIARDITERRRAERDLQNTLSLLGATLESTADGILVVDPDGRITSFNTRFAEMWRLPASILASGDDRAAISFVLDQLQDPDAFVAKVQSLYHQPEAESHDTLHFKDGREFERSSKPQRVAGAVVGRVWSFHDVTDRKRLEAELAGARDKALDASRLKSEFLATMSHEIRTPMNGVIGLTSLLLDTPLTEPQRQFAHGIHTSGEALLKIINDILDFSKIEAGKLELEMMDFDLGEAIEEVAALAAEPARARGLELVTYASPAIPGVRGDVGRLRQVLLNLVSNAVKFTSDGEVVIRASVGPSFDRGEVMVRLEVTDTGIGIAPEATENLFEPFSQADASTTRRYGGTGLGLAICRRLTEAMGGTIGVQSELGHGSTFWLDLPLVPASPPDPLTHPSIPFQVCGCSSSTTTRPAARSWLPSYWPGTLPPTSHPTPTPPSSISEVPSPAPIPTTWPWWTWPCREWMAWSLAARSVPIPSCRRFGCCCSALWRSIPKMRRGRVTGSASPSRPGSPSFAWRWLPRGGSQARRVRPPPRRQCPPPGPGAGCSSSRTTPSTRPSLGAWRRTSDTAATSPATVSKRWPLSSDAATTPCSWTVRCRRWMASRPPPRSVVGRAAPRPCRSSP
jgi:PAS domain S-box-containing protein